MDAVQAYQKQAQCVSQCDWRCLTSDSSCAMSGSARVGYVAVRFVVRPPRRAGVERVCTSQLHSRLSITADSTGHALARRLYAQPSSHINTAVTADRPFSHSLHSTIAFSSPHHYRTCLSLVSSLPFLVTSLPFLVTAPSSIIPAYIYPPSYLRRPSYAVFSGQD